MTRVLLSIAISLACSCGAVAADLFGPRLELVLSGTAFEGPPAFTVTVDGETVGEGVVEASIESSQGLTITPELIVRNAQLFRFVLPYGADPSIVEVSFTNDHYGGEERPYLDRNLYILSVSYEGAEIPRSNFTLPDSTSYLGEEIVAIFSNGTVRVQIGD